MIIIIKKTLLYLIVFLFVTNCSTIRKYDFTGISSPVIEEKIGGKRLDIRGSQIIVKVDKEASQLPIIL